MIYIKKKHPRTDLGGILWVFIFLIIFLLSTVLIRTVITAGEEEGTAIAEQSIRHAAVSCYALEGRYPEDLGYLLENYHITINTDRYTVHYSATGPNLMPDITVLPKSTG